MIEIFQPIDIIPLQASQKAYVIISINNDLYNNIGEIKHDHFDSFL